MSKAPQKLMNLAGPGAIIARSPGRINLIGEHTDYNLGYVLPAAIDRAVYVSVEKSNDEKITAYSVDFEESIEIRIDEIKPMPGYWATYIFGVVDQLRKNGYEVAGFNINVYGDVPLGAGLSSSAAIECATAFGLDQLFEFNIDRKKMASICQLAEHTYAGVKCGIMDQFASLFGKKDHVIKLDCRSLDFEYIPLETKGHSVVLFDTQVKHSLASSEYNVRHAQCEQAVSMIKEKFPEVNSLRDATMEMVNSCIPQNDIIYNRARYILEENQRLLEGCKDLQRGDLVSFGKKMYGSHEGLSKLYEVSCAELDFLVEQVKGRDEITGARMMGGGFGGCTINLIREDAVEDLSRKISQEYKDQMGKELAIYTVTLENGSSLM
jgi:galactokinase